MIRIREFSSLILGWRLYWGVVWGVVCMYCAIYLGIYILCGGQWDIYNNWNDRNDCSENLESFIFAWLGLAWFELTILWANLSSFKKKNKEKRARPREKISSSPMSTSWCSLRILSFVNLYQFHIFSRKFDLLPVDR